MKTIGSFRRMRAIAGLSAALAASGAHAQSGLLTKGTDLEPITLSSGKPLAEAPYELQAGKYYRLTIQCDGTDSFAIGGAEFFRNMWINKIEIEDVAVAPLGLDSISFDGEGEAEISFIPIRPGTFELRIPGTTRETQAATFHVN